MLQDIVFKSISAHLECQSDVIGLDMRLDALGVDSLGAITIMYELEDQLNIEIPNEVFDSLVYVQDIVSQLERILESKSR